MQRRATPMNIASPLASLLALVLLVSCSGDSTGEGSAQGGGSGLEGVVSLDGSSTVYPISEAMAEEFIGVAPRVRVTVGVSGTGGGFKKFLASEIDINDASRPIKDSERLEAEANGLEYLEIPVAFDGLSIVVNPENDWVDHLSIDELRIIWQPGSTVTNWSDVRPEWPDEPIRLYGPGTDSGTFDYFTEAVNGESGHARPDYTSSEDDNVIVQGITGDKYSLGFFGYAYYVANQARVRVVPVDGGNGPVLPSYESIQDGSYSPLSRPVFIYVNKSGAAKPQVRRFVEFYLEAAPQLVSEVGYIALPDAQYQASLANFAAF